MWPQRWAVKSSVVVNGEMSFATPAVVLTSRLSPQFLKITSPLQRHGAEPSRKVGQ